MPNKIIFSDDQKKEIINLFLQDANCVQIGEIFRVSSTTIINFLKQEGVYKEENIKYQEKINLILNLHKQGHTTKEIAEICNCKFLSINRILRKLNLKGNKKKIVSKRLISQSEYVNKCIKKFGDNFDYKDTIYKGMYEKVDVICKKHGKIKIGARHHLISIHGCPHCVIDWRKLPRREGLKLTNKEIIELYANGKTAHEIGEIANCSNALILTILRENNQKIRPTSSQKCLQEDVMKKFENIHKEKYDYSLAEYQGGHVKIKIKCRVHNKIFLQTPHNHLQGQGCPECGKLNLHGFSKSKYLETCKKHNQNPILYLIKIYNTTEEFAKIGITVNPLKIRFSKGMLPNYHYMEIQKIEGDAESIWNLEKSLHRTCKIYKYKPDGKFGGSTECYKLENLPEILEIWNRETAKLAEK